MRRCGLVGAVSKAVRSTTGKSEDGTALGIKVAALGAHVNFSCLDGVYFAFDNLSTSVGTQKGVLLCIKNEELVACSRAKRIKDYHRQSWLCDH